MRWLRNVRAITERKEVIYIAGIMVLAAGALFFIVDMLGGDAFVLRSEAPAVRVRTGAATTTGVIVDIDYEEGVFLLEEDAHTRLLIEIGTMPDIEDETGVAVPPGFLATGFRVDIAGAIRDKILTAEHIGVIESPEIAIQEPASGARIGDAFIVRGVARSQSGILVWRLMDADARERARGTASLHAINGSRNGFFSFPVVVAKTSLHDEEMRLELSRDINDAEDAPYKSVLALILIDQPMFAASLYFANAALGTADTCESVFETARLLPATTTPEFAAVEAFIGGPTPEERQNGFVALVPENTLLSDMKITHNRASLAFISSASAISACRKVAIRSALTRIFAQFPHIREVNVIFDETK